MMLVVSWGDRASRLVFALGLLQCMETVKEILEPVQVKASRQAVDRPSSRKANRHRNEPTPSANGYEVGRL